MGCCGGGLETLLPMGLCQIFQRPIHGFAPTGETSSKHPLTVHDRNYCIIQKKNRPILNFHSVNLKTVCTWPGSNITVLCNLLYKPNNSYRHIGH